MLVDPGSAAGSTVTGAIRQAAQATGTSFSYLLATAQVESGLHSIAGAATSSARGLFQFVTQTWLGMIKQAGAALGYGQYADAITRNGSGEYRVEDPAMRSEILKLRNDPAASALFAGAFTQANAAYLASQIGRAPTEAELYIAHFLGAGGAARLIDLAASQPNLKAGDAFPNAAQANPSIFFDRRTGAARSIAEVRDVLAARYEVARSATATADGQVQANPAPVSPVQPNAAAVPASPLVPDTAGITGAFAAATPVAPRPPTQIFHDLFSDRDRTAPVAALVSQLWTAPNVPAGAAGMIADLFKDSGQHS